MHMEKNAIMVLAEDHAAVQALFARVSQPDEDRPAVLGQLLRSLSAHVAAEKQLVVPILVVHADEGKALADQLGDDHDAIEKLVIRVERRKVNSPDVPDLVNELLQIVTRHSRQADECVLPFLGDHLSEAELADLGAALRSDELQLASHPHPHLPDTGPLAKVTRKAAALFDRGRDSSTDLRRPGL
jgi:Hemerythrin HHE cation binding domain